MSDDGSFVILNREEGRAMFDRCARDWLGMSGEEFVRRYKAGEWPMAVLDDPEHPKHMRLWFMLPFWGDDEQPS